MIASIILGKLSLSDWHHCCFSLSDVDIAAHLHLRPFHCFLSVSSAIGSRQEVMLHKPSERDMAFPHCLFIFLLLISFSVLNFTTLSSHPPPCLYHYHHRHHLLRFLPTPLSFVAIGFKYNNSFTINPSKSNDICEKAAEKFLNLKFQPITHPLYSDVRQVRKSSKFSHLGTISNYQNSSKSQFSRLID